MVRDGAVQTKGTAAVEIQASTESATEVAAAEAGKERVDTKVREERRDTEAGEERTDLYTITYPVLS